MGCREDNYEERKFTPRTAFSECRLEPSEKNFHQNGARRFHTWLVRTNEHGGLILRHSHP